MKDEELIMKNTTSKAITNNINVNAVLHFDQAAKGVHALLQGLAVAAPSAVFRSEITRFSVLATHRGLPVIRANQSPITDTQHDFSYEIGSVPSVVDPSYYSGSMEALLANTIPSFAALAKTIPCKLEEVDYQEYDSRQVILSTLRDLYVPTEQFFEFERVGDLSFILSQNEKSDLLASAIKLVQFDTNARLWNLCALVWYGRKIRKSIQSTLAICQSRMEVLSEDVASLIAQFGRKLDEFEQLFVALTAVHTTTKHLLAQRAQREQEQAKQNKQNKVDKTTPVAVDSAVLKSLMDLF